MYSLKNQKICVNTFTVMFTFESVMLYDHKSAQSQKCWPSAVPYLVNVGVFLRCQQLVELRVHRVQQLHDLHSAVRF